MDVTDVVDHQAKGKGLLVVLVIELFLDLVDVGAFGDFFTLEEGSEIAKSAKHVRLGHLEVGVVADVLALGEDGLVDEVPVALEGVTLALDVVSEGGALGEGVVILIAGQAGLRVRKERKDGEGRVESIRCLALENSLSSAGY